MYVTFPLKKTMMKNAIMHPVLIHSTLYLWTVFAFYFKGTSYTTDIIVTASFLLITQKTTYKWKGIKLYVIQYWLSFSCCFHLSLLVCVYLIVCVKPVWCLTHFFLDELCVSVLCLDTYVNSLSLSLRWAIARVFMSSTLLFSSISLSIVSKIHH